MHDLLVITLVHHPRFGYLLQPLFASYNPDAEVYTMTEVARVTSPTYHSLRAEEQEIVRLGERYSDRALMKSYSKEEKEEDFLQKVTSATIETYIRPFIEKRQNSLIELARKVGTPLFSREKINVRDFRLNQRLEVLNEPSSMIFHFRNREAFTYHAEVQNGEEHVNLFEQFHAQLVSNPAVVVIGRQLHHFVDVDEKKLRPFFKKPYIEIPPRSIPEYMRSFVVPCVKNYTVVTEGIPVFRQEYRPEAVLTLETDFDLRPVLSLRFHYGKHRFAPDKPYKKEVEAIEEEGEFMIGWFYREREWERERVQLLLEAGLSLSKSGQFVVANAAADAATNVLADAAAGDERQAGPDSLQIIEWINQNGELLEHNFTVKQAMGKQAYYTGEISLQIEVNEGIDWFDFYCMVRFGEVEIPFTRFRRHLLQGTREFALPDGRVAVLPLEWFSRFGEMFSFGKVSGSRVRLPRYHFRLKQLAVNGAFSEQKFEQEEGGQLVATPVPEALNATLRPYQFTGFQWLMNLQQRGFGGCLADDMGLGKTLQTIALLLQQYRGVRTTKEDSHFLAASPSRVEGASRGIPEPRVKPEKKVPRQLSLFDDLTPEITPEPTFEPTPDPTFESNELPPTLIVMPTSLIHNWVNEFRKFAPSLQLYLHVGTQRARCDEFQAEAEKTHVVLTTYGIVRQDIEFLSQHPFHYLILDESQYIKNHTSLTFKRVKELRSSHKLALTGTPLENSLSDLWSQMDFLNDGILGEHGHFKSRYREADVISNGREQQKLLKIIDPFILRRTKEEVAPELPPLVQETVYCQMEEEQEAAYLEEKSKIRNALLERKEEEGRAMAAIALTGLTRLRQMANHPGLSMESYEGGSAKLERIIEQAEILFAGHHKVLIFSSFVQHLTLLADRFDERGWRYAWLTGSTVNREEVIDRFNNDESVGAFFISLKAGGTGLNLTAADYVFIMDPWWNPAAEMQAVSRAHRIGQEKKVTLYRFITKGTVEEKIQQLQRYKKELTDTVIRHRFSLEEMEALLE